MTSNIYGIYLGETCIYVGQSGNPQRRFFQHKNPVRGKFRHLAECIHLKVFRRVALVDAVRIEDQVIAAFRRLGCPLRDNRKASSRVSFAGEPVRCLETSELFPSRAEAERHLGISYGGISRAWSEGRNLVATAPGKEPKTFTITAVAHITK